MARVRHGDEEWCAYHITTRTLGGKFLLSRAQDKQVIVSALEFYRDRKDFELYGFVVMDNHIHLVLRPAEGIGLSAIVDRLKTWTSRRNFTKRGSALWERRYDDNRIKSRKEMQSVLRYIHGNPVRADMASRPEDYLWSSVHNYAGNGQCLIEIDTEW